jgi:neutral/alkaline ceramidase-like enzyme
MAAFPTVRAKDWRSAFLVLGLTLLAWGPTAEAAETDWRIGLSAVRVTPEEPLPMCGYNPTLSEGVLDDLYAKAIAIEDVSGSLAVLLTADLLFFRAPFAEVVCNQIMERTGLRREQILLNASHTHAGPVFGIEDPGRFDLPDDQRQRVKAYTDKLVSQLVNLIPVAIADLKPARLSWSTGEVDFVMNRRLITPEGRCRGMGPNPHGPVDRSVPVLRVDEPDGRLRAVVFGCACHPVTLDGHNRKISGDYASAAQRYLQARHPDVQAMFIAGCGADANSHPRGGPEQEAWVARHGETLGKEVNRVLDEELHEIRGALQAELATVDLPLEHEYSRPQLEEMATEGQSYWHKENARGMLATLDRGEPLPEAYRSSIALWRFGNDLTLIGLPGEAVADYVPRIQKALEPAKLWIAAYCNESFGYLPTAEILKQGGHESMGLTLAVGLFSPKVEETVMATVRRLAEETQP